VFWFALLVVFAYAIYVLRPDERKRVALWLARHLGAAVDAVRHRAGRTPDAFDEALAARATRPYLTLVVLALDLLVFAGMLIGGGSMSDQQTLVGWGGSIGPLTANGAWWRLLTATFVHRGLVHFVVDMAALGPIAVVVERVFGRAAFAGMYVAAAVLAGAIGLWADPLTVAVGASAPILAFNGLLVALVIRGTLQRSALSIPRRVLRHLAAVSAICVVYYMSRGGAVWMAALGMFVIGFGIGVALTRGVTERTPPPQRVLPLVVVTMALALLIVTPLKGMVDVRARIAQLVPVEDRLAARYQAETDQFTRGRIRAAELAATIEREILPALDTQRTEIGALTGMPRQQQPLVDGALEYLRLRQQSWKTRATALRTSNMRLLREADATERAALERLAPLRQVLAGQ
jgi:membrane associated rhomboid family serine protease